MRETDEFKQLNFWLNELINKLVGKPTQTTSSANQIRRHINNFEQPAENIKLLFSNAAGRRMETLKSLFEETEMEIERTEIEYQHEAEKTLRNDQSVQELTEKTSGFLNKLALYKKELKQERSNVAVVSEICNLDPSMLDVLIDVWHLDDPAHKMRHDSRVIRAMADFEKADEYVQICVIDYLKKHWGLSERFDQMANYEQGLNNAPLFGFLLEMKKRQGTSDENISPRIPGIDF